MDAIGGNQSLAAMRANALIASHISTQAFIRAVCDDFLVASMITIAAFVPILFLRVRKRKNRTLVAWTKQMRSEKLLAQAARREILFWSICALRLREATFEIIQNL